MTFQILLAKKHDYSENCLNNKIYFNCEIVDDNIHVNNLYKFHMKSTDIGYDSVMSQIKMN